jgi:hypothetical protein
MPILSIEPNRLDQLALLFSPSWSTFISAEDVQLKGVVTSIPDSRQNISLEPLKRSNLPFLSSRGSDVSLINPRSGWLSRSWTNVARRKGYEAGSEVVLWR